jgi:hypothetical protein
MNGGWISLCAMAASLISRQVMLSRITSQWYASSSGLIGEGETNNPYVRSDTSTVSEAVDPT